MLWPNSLIVPLATHANAYLAGGEGAFEAIASSGGVSPEGRELFSDTWIHGRTLAADRQEWLCYLRKHGVRRTRLAIPDQRLDYWETHFNEAFHGGYNWALEAVGSERAEYWHVRARRNAPNPQSFEVHWGRFHTSAHLTFLQAELAVQEAELRSVLTELLEYTAEFHPEEWMPTFAKALSAWETDEPERISPLGRLFPPNGYGLAARRVAYAALVADVFGGMGWWNDTGGAPTEEGRARFQELTPRLANAIVRGIVAAIDSFGSSP